MLMLAPRLGALMKMLRIEQELHRRDEKVDSESDSVCGDQLLSEREFDRGTRAPIKVGPDRCSWSERRALFGQWTAQEDLMSL